MSWARNTSLVANVAEVVQLTGQQDLLNLESTAELALTDLLLSASQAIFDQVSGQIDPTLLTNEYVYKQAVAQHFLAKLVMLGYLNAPANTDPIDPERGPYQYSDPYVKNVTPVLGGDGDEPRHGLESLPTLANPRSNQDAVFYRNLPEFRSS